MNVHDANFSAPRPDPVRHRAVERAEKPQAEAAAKDAADVKAMPVEDRLEISDTARAESERADELKRDIEFARRAMYSAPPLSLDRAEEILDKLEKGDYNAPDVRIKLADMLAKDLGFQSDAPEAGGEAESA